MADLPNLIILIGIPGSGKSRWALNNPQYYRVCPDEIRKSFGDISDQSNNSIVWAITKGMVKAALELHHNVVLDATNVNTTYRRKFYEDLPLHKRHAKVFEIDPEVATKRIHKDIVSSLKRADVPELFIYRKYGEFLYSVRYLFKENFESIIDIAQESF